MAIVVVNSSRNSSSIINSSDYSKLKAEQMQLYNRIREDVGRCPIFSKEHCEEVSHPTIGIARARLVSLLKNKACYDKVEPLKPMPTADCIDWTFFHPYQVDVYAEKYHPECNGNGNVITDRLVVDIYRQLPWNPKLKTGQNHREEAAKKGKRLTTLLPDYEIKRSSQPTIGADKPKFVKSCYNTDYSVLRRGLRKKKELICSHHNIEPVRYIELLEVQLFHRPFEREYESFANRVQKGHIMLDDDQMLELLCGHNTQKISG